MSNNYDKFLRRMIQYREGLHLTQKDVSSFFGKDQSQFSKMELGKTVVSYEILESLKNVGWDIDYIITGKEKINLKSSLAGYLKEKLGMDWKNLNEALVWILGHELRKCGCPVNRDVKCEYELLKQFLDQEPPNSRLLAIRNTLGISQITISEKMGINIKKYCLLEKGSKNPDAGLLGSIYELAYCRPGVFFYQGDVAEYLLDCLWNRIKETQQKEAIEYLEYTITIYKA